MKNKQKHIHKIKEWKSSKQENHWYLTNFLGNLSRSASLMHRCLKEFNDKSLIQEAKRNYIISIVTSLETFYRDLFIYVLEKDDSILQNALSSTNENYKLSDIHHYMKEKISLAEIAACSYSFQNIEEIDCAMSKIFLSEGYIKTLSSSQHFFIAPSIAQAGKMALPKKWENKFNEIFKMRHAFVHNANRRCDLNSKDMGNLEFLVLQVTQLTSIILSKQYNDEFIGAKGYPV